MNILFLSTENPYPPDHGHHIRTYNILKCLARKNKIFFIGFEKSENLIAKEKLEKLCETVDMFLLPEGKWKWRFFFAVFGNLFSPLPFAVKKYFRKEARKRLRQIIKENNVDLIHVDMLHLGLYYDDIKQFPNVLVNHNVESIMLRRKIKIQRNFIVKLYLLLQYFKLYRFEKKVCSMFDKCIVVSEVDKDILMNMSPQADFDVIPNGVDVDYYFPNDNESRISGLSWMGGMKDEDNKDAVDYFLDEIWPKILAEIPDVTACFVGKSPTKKLVKNAKENQNIKIMGYVEDVRPYILQSLVFIAPLRSGSGTKLKVLNAMAMGKAVVTTSIGAEGIKVTPDENIMIADNPQDFAEKIIYLLRHPEIAIKIGKEARQVIEKYYDWKVIDKNMEQIYQKVLSNNRC